MGQVTEDRTDFGERCTRCHNRCRGRLIEHRIEDGVGDRTCVERQVHDAAAADIVDIGSHGDNLGGRGASSINVHRQGIGQLRPERSKLRSRERQVRITKHTGDTEIRDVGSIRDQRVEVASVHRRDVDQGRTGNGEPEQNTDFGDAQGTRNAQVGNLTDRETIDDICRIRGTQQHIIRSKRRKLGGRCTGCVHHAYRNIGCAAVRGIKDLQDIGDRRILHRGKPGRQIDRLIEQGSIVGSNFSDGTCKTVGHSPVAIHGIDGRKLSLGHGDARNLHIHIHQAQGKLDHIDTAKGDQVGKAVLQGHTRSRRQQAVRRAENIVDRIDDPE